MPDDIGKRIIHAACGAVLGFCFGALIAYKIFSGKIILRPGLAGALIVALLAFFYTDSFWESFKNGRR
ncbi:MAG: hypothetical protein A2017_19595 [Lentisphaerae bacterium GWF2_44_16]|nr:MAG: hypothetical protein A2017_19595 [Lentisphaerae bacterium GWF2_44_16]